MQKLNLAKNNKLLIVFLSALLVLLSGCGDYIPRTEFTITTDDRQKLTLACPVIDAGRSTFTYRVDGDCVIYKKAN